jgi:hypothetical protein
MVQQSLVGQGLLIIEASRSRARAHTRTRTHTHTHTRTLGRTPLDESAQRRDLLLTTHNTHKTDIRAPGWDSNPQTQHANGRKHMP